MKTHAADHPKVLMFDLDGTLIDRNGALFGQVAGAMGYARSSRRLVEQVQPERCVIELLRSLTERYRLVLVSNGSPGTQRGKLRRAGLNAFFHTVVISGEVGVAKPDPAIFHHACCKADCQVDDVVMMVGDDVHSDIQSAASLGIPTCWISRGRALPVLAVVPTFTIDSVLAVEEVMSCSKPAS